MNTTYSRLRLSGLISHQEASVTILHLSLYETLRKGFEPEIWDASEASA